MVDSIGQDFLNAISQINLEEDDIRSIIEIFSRHCKFQEDIDTTELDAIPIFATRAAERRSIQKKYRRFAIPIKVLLRSNALMK